MKTKRDRSEHKRAEEATHRAMSLLTSTINATADGILVIDNEGGVAIFNKKFLSMWRIPESLTAQRDDKILLDYGSDSGSGFLCRGVEDGEER